MSCTSYGARSRHRTMLRLLGLRHSGTARFLLRRLAAGLGCSGRGALRTRTPSSSEVMPLSAALGFLSPTISWCRRALAFSSSSVDSPLAWAGGGDVIAARRAANARAAGDRSAAPKRAEALTARNTWSGCVYVDAEVYSAERVCKAKHTHDEIRCISASTPIAPRGAALCARAQSAYRLRRRARGSEVGPRRAALCARGKKLRTDDQKPLSASLKRFASPLVCKFRTPARASSRASAAARTHAKPAEG